MRYLWIKFSFLSEPLTHNISPTSITFLPDTKYRIRYRMQYRIRCRIQYRIRCRIRYLSRPTERWCESFGGMKIGTMRLFATSRGGPHNLYSIQDIVEPCGQGHSGRHPTHKSVFHAARLTERRRKRRKSRGKLRPCWHTPAGGAGVFPPLEQTAW